MLHLPLRGFPDIERTRVVGVVNVTPDSFSDGGEFLDPERAVEQGLALVAAGADLVDVGGESTRPGAERIDETEELRRITPVVRELVAAGVLVSIDTSRAHVAEVAVGLGAQLVNDVTGGTADPGLLAVVADAGVACVLMHTRGPSADMASRATYDDVVADVCAELGERLDAARAAGIADDQVVVDPGLGFAKSAEHSLTLLAALPELAKLGRPVLVGASRKSFLGSVLDGRAVDEREAATQAVTALAAWHGAWAVRVHDARPAADAVRVVAAIRRGRV